MTEERSSFRSTGLSDNAPTRLPRVDHRHLTPGQRRFYDAVVGGRRSSTPFPPVDDDGNLRGPFHAMLHAPELGMAVQALGEHLRFQSSLGDRLRELSICVVAAELDCHYLWSVHSQIALRVGASTDQLQSIRAGDDVPDLTAAEAAGLRLCYAIVRRQPVDDDTFTAAAGHLGLKRSIELSILVGYYAMLAGLLRTVAMS